MGRPARFAVSLILAALLGAATPPPATIDYVVTPVVGPGGLETLEISVSLAGDADGATAIALPDQWAGSAGLHEAIIDLSVTGGTLAPGAGPARRIVTHAAGAALLLHYRLGPLAVA